jgi:hypothetical protein
MDALREAAEYATVHPKEKIIFEDHAGESGGRIEIHSDQRPEELMQAWNRRLIPGLGR